jgi:ABC-2 type transport system permease protein
MSIAAGTGSLVRLAVRRSRILLGAGIVVMVLVATEAANATVDLYPTVASRFEAASSLNDSKALVAMFGRIYDPSSVGAIAMIKMGSFGAVFVALLAVVLVVRLTRGDEEAGRTEMIGATAMGRGAPLASALIVVGAGNLVLALLTGVALSATGLPADGSFAFGLAWASVGLAFGAIAAVAAQLTTSARTATSMSAAILGLVYILRAVGDTAEVTGPRWLSWLSPIGWGQQFRPYAGNRWWVLSITISFAVAVSACAFALSSKRDLGAGVVPTRPGPATASPRLRTPLALAWRLHGGAFLGWAVGFALVGAVLGNMASSVGEFINNPSSQEFITKLGGVQALTDAFLAVELSFAGVIASGFGIQALMRLRSEETGQRAEPVLATAVGRTRWAASHILIAVAGTTLLMVIVGASAGIAHGAQIGDMGAAWRVLAAALVQLPAAWVLGAIVVAAFGLAPRFVAIGWVALAAFVLLGELGPLMNLDQWVMDLSPFAHVPRLPGGTFATPPLVALVGVAALRGLVGLAGFRRRDIDSY